ncbi:unnamed protein product [Rotaria sp. Silwood1]|nr:unnamed protein product [Rotaria sp. Silwood1]
MFSSSSSNTTTVASTNTVDDNWKIIYLATLTSIIDLNSLTVDYWNDNEIHQFMQQLLGCRGVTRQLWYRWQIEHVDSRLPRQTHAIEDGRVKHYIPDEWQIKFLDTIDRNESCLIVAPTSSGKTYASYYAIDSVLKTSKNGICVYVGPTKALVNQVHAILYFKYAKTNYSVGIFTRDFRSNVDNCRVLCTVPHCLQILLLSPIAEHQNLCNKIKYVIFDEVHSMSNDNVWETCMMFLDSPMIGLSATVNNGQEIQRWLKTIELRRYELKQVQSVRPVRFIESHKRLTDLHKYLYSNKQLHSLHPIGLMDIEQLIKNGCLPNDLTLSPKETLQLYDAMSNENNHNHIPLMTQYSRNIPSLEEFFHDDWIIEREKFDSYGKLVIKQFNQMIRDKNLTLMNSIKNQLSVDLVSKEYPQSIEMNQLIIDFILTLERTNQLPCIVFSDSRCLCEEMAKYIVDYYKHKENGIRQSDAFRRDIEMIKKKQREVEKLRKYYEDKPSNKKMDEATVRLLCDDLQLSGVEHQKLTGILPECTLITRAPSRIEKQFLERSYKRTTSLDLLEYIQRGVAFHHAGVNKRQRTVVEALFRSGFLKVIFSTSTLASGIHMPCKTVAFVKDSVWFDALYYRQASGRAGRRGFDLQGNIVFLNIPLIKISHLTVSSVPDVYSHFPTTVTFLLRMLHLYTKSSTKQHRKIAYIRSRIALECPLCLSLNTPPMSTINDIQTRLHCLYTLDFLRRLNLMNESGQLIGLGGLVIHLLPYEPANILLSYLIETNLFSNNHFEIDYDKQIVMILSYLFTHVPFYAEQHQYEDHMKKRKDEKYNSLVLLPEKTNMSPHLRQRLDDYDELVRFVYEQYFVSVINELRKQFPHADQSLPLSKVDFKTFDIYDHGTFEYQLHHHYTFQNETFLSPFAGVSGVDNDD